MTKTAAQKDGRFHILTARHRAVPLPVSGNKEKPPFPKTVLFCQIKIPPPEYVSPGLHTIELNTLREYIKMEDFIWTVGQ